jgi:hypothetical protein
MTDTLYTIGTLVMFIDRAESLHRAGKPRRMLTTAPACRQHRLIGVKTLKRRFVECPLCSPVIKVH